VRWPATMSNTTSTERTCISEEPRNGRSAGRSKFPLQNVSIKIFSMREDQHKKSDDAPEAKHRGRPRVTGSLYCRRKGVDEKRAVDGLHYKRKKERRKKSQGMNVTVGAG
jgi:hypothetical protein